MANRVFVQTPINDVIRERVAQMTKEQAIRYAHSCATWVWSHFPHIKPKAVINKAYQVLDDYLEGKSTVQQARAASLAVHQEARRQRDPVTKRLYRVIGHMVATIHVPTHAYGPYAYGLSALHERFPDIPVTEWTDTLVEFIDHL